MEKHKSLGQGKCFILMLNERDWEPLELNPRQKEGDKKEGESPAAIHRCPSFRVR